MLLTPIEVRDAVGMALGALRQNKLRTFLTILGVMVGVSSVIGLASVINGFNGAMEAEIEAIGSTTIIEIQRFGPGTDWDDLTEEERNRPFLTAGEANIIKATCPAVDGVAPMNHHWEQPSNTIKYSNQKVEGHRFLGTWPDFLGVLNRSMKSGRFVSKVDLDLRANVVVLGDDIAENLFEGIDPVGKEVRLNGNLLEVVGVLNHLESNFEEDWQNNLAIIPLSTFEKFHPWDEALTLTARAESLEKLDQAKEEIISALRIYRNVPFNKENNFALTTQDTYKEQAENITQYIYLGGLTITLVGLMVGGIGVMNIMLVSVTERTREIGVRKAIGAKRSNILLQFLTEAMTLSGTGGVIGIIFGVVAGLGINAILEFPITISIFWVITGFVGSVSVGLVSGVYPAYKASRLDPIEALRYE